MSTLSKHCCTKCNYSTTSIKNFQRHLNSVKHKKLNNDILHLLENLIGVNKSFQENVTKSHILMQEIYGKLVMSHNNFVNVLSNNNNVLLENVTSIVKTHKSNAGDNV